VRVLSATIVLGKRRPDGGTHDLVGSFMSGCCLWGLVLKTEGRCRAVCLPLLW
jgi:hypothetical protein